MFEYVCNNKELCNTQNMGIIKLLPKDGDLRLIENWRPITLLCVDYKIISKILANRMKTVLNKLVSAEQFCSVKNRSIVNCNTLIRDIIYYINDEKLQAALINLDWCKAFDRVPIEFVLKILMKYGIN